MKKLIKIVALFALLLTFGLAKANVAGQQAQFILFEAFASEEMWAKFEGQLRRFNMIDEDNNVLVEKVMPALHFDLAKTAPQHLRLLPKDMQSPEGFQAGLGRFGLKPSMALAELKQGIMEKRYQLKVGAESFPVAAASAPIVTAPVAVAEAPAPAVKPAAEAGGELATKDLLFAELRKQREEIIAPLTDERRVFLATVTDAVKEVKSREVTKEQVEKFVDDAVKAVTPDPAEQKVIKEAVSKVGIIEDQIKALDTKYEKKYEGVATDVTNIGSKLNVAIAGGLALLAVACLILWRRITTTRKEVIRVVEDRAAEAVRTVKADAALATEEAEQATKQVAGLAKRVSDIEAAVTLKRFSFEDDDILTLVYSLPIGGTTSFEFTVDEESFMLHFERVDAIMAKVHGIKDQRNPVKIDGLPARIKRAANKGGLIGITPITDVVALPRKVA